MSINRRAAKRDVNEPAIRARLKAHGWHTEQVSGKGMPDLIGWSKHRVDVLLLEVKMPGKGPTPAQVTKWTELLTRGIRVYVLQTDNDVDYLAKGRLEPWTPGETMAPTRKHGPRDAPIEVRTRLGTPVRKAYLPPQTKRPDPRRDVFLPSIGSPSLAAETFAPPLTTLGSEMMREMMKPPGDENYTAAFARVAARCGCTIEVECAEHAR